MWKKVLVVGATTAAIVGAGTAALAVTGSASPTPAPSTGTGTGTAAAGTHAKAKHDRHDALRRSLHATWTTKAAKGSTGYVTHDAIRGVVSAVSTTSISVKAADGVTETFAVDAATIEHLKADGKTKGTAGRISKVLVGDKVGVVGTGATSLTATHVVDATH